MAEKKPYFDEVDLKVDFPAMERENLDYWDKKGIVRKYLQKNRSSRKNFSFLDGPITANNPMGVHHAWGRTYKDLWQRYKNMQGFAQRFQNGFDCQGLWVEVEVEKELGLRSKKDIENLVPKDKKASIAKFVELCKARVIKYANIQTQQSKRLGYFMDWDNSYYTMSDENNYMIWHFLKKCYEDGRIYKGRDSVPWCPRCGTAISQHEILTEDYKEATHDSIYMEYPIKGRKNEYLLVWTTTPWTLPGNVAVVIDADKDYVIARGAVAGNKYYLNEFAAKRLGLKIEGRIPGKKLVGLKYLSPFDELPRVKKSLGKYEHMAVASDTQILPVSEEEGTGMVHVAPGAGTEDFQLGKKLGFPVIELIDEEANYISDLGEFSAKNAKKHPELIIDFLRKKDAGRYLFNVAPYVHRYPACWRCKTELVWRVVDEWYIAMDRPSSKTTDGKHVGETLRKKMMGVAKKIRWIPKFGLERELDWLANMHDWLISKKRYWGLALPIWECTHCGNFEVIGGKEELRQKAVSGWEVFNGKSPHRPWIDEVKLKCVHCRGIMKRIPDVGNPWLDAGIVSYSTISKDNSPTPLYEKDKKAWEKWFPADFITESFPGQFKNWFYSLIAESTALTAREPFKTVLGFATLFGEDGRPMHKSWGNAIEFNEGAEAMGVDVMRWMYIRQNPEDNLLFGYHHADETRRRFHLKLWNVYNFFVTYANLDGWSPTQKSKVKSLPAQAGEKLKVIDRWILSRLNQTIGAVTKSLEDYSAYSASALIEEFVDDLSNWYIRRSRKRVGPSSGNEKEKDIFYETTYFILVTLSKLLAPFLPFMPEEIYRNLTKRESAHLDNWPTAGEVDKSLISDMAYIRGIVEDVHAQRKDVKIALKTPLRLLTTFAPSAIKTKGLDVYLKDELNVKNWKLVKGRKLKNILDTKITPDLEEEAKTRELIRKIQEERKRLGMGLAQKILITNHWIPTSQANIDMLKRATLARDIREGEFGIKGAS